MNVKMLKEFRQMAKEYIVVRAVVPGAYAIFRINIGIHHSSWEAVDDKNQWTGEHGLERRFSSIDDLMPILREKRREYILELCEEERIERLNKLAEKL